jgi:hypothetical protein
LTIPVNIRTFVFVPEYGHKKSLEDYMKKTSALVLLLAILSIATPTLAFSQQKVQIYTQAEQGTLKLLAHRYRVGASADGNDDFDFVRQGGQEILFFFDRYTAGITVGDRHDISFLYQPLEIVTDVKFQEDVEIDDVTFSAGTPMRLSYGFPFYRLTYRYRIIGDNRNNLSAGAAVQLRNASIRFEAKSGASNQLVVSQNLGIVPALSIAGRLALGSKGFLGFEATGIYASSALFNGANFDFEGSILDASIRGGLVLSNNSEVFLNGRFFGGSARGISQYPDLYWTEATSDESSNVIAAISITAGATLKL